MSADLYAAFGASEQIVRTVQRQGNSAGIVSGDHDACATEASPIADSKTLSERAVQEALWRKDHSDVDVLFDAFEDHQADDDFGDFEDAQQESVPTFYSSQIKGASTQNEGTADLLGLEEEELDHQASTPSGIALMPTNDAHGAPETQPVLLTGMNEDWGDFSRAPSQAKLPSQFNDDIPVGSSPEEDWEPFENESVRRDETSGHANFIEEHAQALEEKELRPANVPPPAVLLETISQNLNRLQQSLTIGTNFRDLTTLINAHFIAAHIIAGRSLRWKRDSHLSQSMKIGPAGGMGGMKLASIHKTENLKEEREVSEVLSTWKRYASFFNAKAKEGASKALAAIRDDRNVRVSPSNQIAARPCALCGLNREERISQIDTEIEDSFGEWWAEHWGHTQCRAWWATNRGLLTSR